MNRLEWSGLYADSWGDDLVPEAFAHPAKYSRGLIRQIYAHMLAEGMIAPGNVIGDPFGGIAAGALDAMLNGLHWRGVELEPRFVSLGNDNIALWASRYAPHFPRWGTAALVQGDSRGFAGIVAGLAGVVSSPPYANSIDKESNGIDTAKFSGRDNQRVFGNGNSNIEASMHYGSTPGQLGSMPPGDLDAVVSSPAYGDTVKKGDGPGARWDAKTHPGNPAKISSATSYGDTPGQVGRLDACVTSPPFEDSIVGDKKKETGYWEKSVNGTITGLYAENDYGTTEGQLGQATGETFWTASRAIVEQVHMALKPGGYVAWICGDFVRKGQRVEFGKQWMTLCESVGFEAHTWVIAWKTERHGTQLGFFEDVERRTDRVSFFRRLANERNPAAAILNEDVIIMRRADD